MEAKFEEGNVVRHKLTECPMTIGQVSINDISSSKLGMVLNGSYMCHCVWFVGRKLYHDKFDEKDLILIK